jgi:hypothetical protein
MSFVAVAVVGAAVVSGVAANKGAKSASKASAAGAASAADATIESTRMQIEEISRQFDYQQQVLAPFVQNQQRAAQAYSNLLGYSSEQLPSSGGPSSMPAQESGGASNMMFRPGGSSGRDMNFSQRPDFGGGGAPKPSNGVTIDGRTGEVVRNGQPFRDPNVNYFAMGRDSAADTELGRAVRDNRLAGPTAGEDELVGYVGRTGLARGASADSGIRRAEDVRLSSLITGNEARDRADSVRLAAPGGYENDPRFKFARDTAIVGDSFTESPGYAFQVEQMGRELDRKNSAGGNYGGRALLEAQRRAQGVAAQDYYNWVGARGADLGRQDAALARYQDFEAADVGRGDVALESDLGRRLATGEYDIGRGDMALGDYRRREELDLARGDAAYENFLGRRGMDVQRGDQAIAENTRLTQYDLQRQDQAYYNYLASLGGAAGLNIGAPQAVASSAQAGAGAAGAYAQQGGQLASIYGQRGQDEANIQLGKYANMNSSIQSGLSNWMTYSAFNPRDPRVTSNYFADPARMGSWG